MYSLSDGAIPPPLRDVFRGIGQVFFQENALTGICFAVGLAASSPLMATGAVVGAAIGTATAWALKFDKAELAAGIWGFNSALVGIAMLFFFQPSVGSIALLIGGCALAAPVTWLMRPGGAVLPNAHDAVHRHDMGPVLSRPSRGCG